MMQENGIGSKQVTQVRGYADQRLRKPNAPEDASNRRISVVVQYLDKPEPEPKPDAAKAAPPAKGAAPPAKGPAPAANTKK
jgi:chemotaxis protein MotB